MKKALIPPMTLMTSPMSGTNMAMRSVTAIQITVRTTLQRLSNEWVTIPLRRLWTRSIKFRMTDLFQTHTNTETTCWVLKHKLNHNTVQLWCHSPPQKKNNRIDGDNWYSKKQPGNDHDHIVSWIWHQNIRGNFSSERHEAVHTWRRRGWMWLAPFTITHDVLRSMEVNSPVRV